MSPETKTCKSCKDTFSIFPEDKAFYAKLEVQAPEYCPTCRFKRRAVWRNEKTLYKRACDLCKKSIITMFGPKAKHPVYCNDCWASDKWDRTAYAKDYDFSRPFFDQLKELIDVVPQSATYSSPALGPNINSDYSNFAGANKDGYLVFNSNTNENAAYSRGLSNCRDTFDTYYAENLERAYECMNVTGSTKVAWAENSSDCLDSTLLSDCGASSNCFGSVNLRHGQYYFFNEKLPKEEYEKRVGEVQGSYSKMEEAKKRFEEHKLKFPQRAQQNIKAVNSTGNYLFETKDCFASFEVTDCENIRYSFSTKNGKDSMDMLGHTRRAELCLEGVGNGIGSRIIASWSTETSHNVEYCVRVQSSSNSIGCVSTKNAEYSILNKAYSPEEYAKIREHIINELKELNMYGSFFPPSIALFAYNESIGQDNMPLTKEEAVEAGFRWEDELPQTKGQETLKPDQIPDHINDVTDSILKEILACKDCGRNYRLTEPEFRLYKDLVLPVPRQCWQCRFADRIKRRGPMKIFDRACTKCQTAIQTSYAPESPEIVYCEACFQKEVL